MSALSANGDVVSVVLAKQTKLLYGALNISLIATLINSCVLIVVLWPVVARELLIGWAVLIWTLSAVRWFVALKYHQQTLDQQALPRWHQYFATGVYAAGIVWGFAAVWLYPLQGIGYQVFLTFVLGGMAAGSLTSLSYDRKLATIFLFLLMVPLVIRVLFSQEQLNIAMGLMLGYFCLMFVLTSNRIGKNIEQNILYELDIQLRHKQIKQSEHRNEVLLQTASDAFFLHDLKGRFIDVNEQACKSTGYSREELLQMSVSDIEKGADEQLLMEMWPTLKAAGKLELECLHRRKDGTTFPVEVHIGPVEIDEHSYVSALVRDITVHKEALESYNQAKLEAQRLNLAKSRFLSHISHELRTPLNAILGFAQLLQLNEKDLNELQKMNVNEIHKAGGYLLEMINELLDLSRIESGKLELDNQAFPMTEVIAECLNLVRSQADSFQVKIIERLTDAECIIWADPVRTKQVILNLLSNGVKYNSHPGELTLECIMVEQKWLRVKISDTGEGIAEQDLLRLFNPFERLDNRPNIEGTGIGLVITKLLIEAMGGEIGVNSHKGQGSVFWLDFVLCKEAVEEQVKPIHGL